MMITFGIYREFCECSLKLAGAIAQALELLDVDDELALALMLSPSSIAAGAGLARRGLAGAERHGHFCPRLIVTVVPFPKYFGSSTSGPCSV